LKKKATLRPTRVVRRCQRCGTINVKQVKTKLLPRPN
jgi:ribosomal protein S14